MKPTRYYGLFLVLLGALLVLMSGCDMLTTGSPNLPPPTAPAGVSGPTFQVFFSTPKYPDKPEYHVGGLDEQMAAAIDSAQTSVYIAAFEFNLQRVADAVVRAHQRGVDVGLVSDSDYAEEDQVKQLQAAGVPVVFDEREPFMHNKFIVIDGHQVWMGSWNLTDNCTYRNNNNMVVIESTQLAENYTREFKEMFEDHQFGPTSPSDTPYPQLEVDGIRLENYFSSEDGVRQHILPLVQNAQKSIYFLAFSFTDDDLGKALVAKAKAGLTVQGVMESRNADGSGSEWTRLRRGKVDLLKDGNPYVMHHKVLIIDEAIVVTGSYNFTGAAENSNDENVLIIYSPEIAAQYLEEFQRIYQQAQQAKEAP